jgi:hypothetical protein
VSALWLTLSRKNRGTSFRTRNRARGSTPITPRKTVAIVRAMYGKNGTSADTRRQSRSPARNSTKLSTNVTARDSQSRVPNSRRRCSSVLQS